MFVCVSLSLFCVGMTSGPERTMQTNFWGNFAEKCLLISLQRFAAVIYKNIGKILVLHEVVFCVLQHKETTFSGALMGAFCVAVEPLNRTRIQVSACYITESTLTERLRVKT